MTTAAALPIRFRASRLGALVKREIRDQLRDWRVVIPMVILTLFFPVLMNFAAQTVINYVNQYGGQVIAEAIFPFLLMIVGFFPTSVGLVIALESFVGEKERYSLEPLLATPLSDIELFLGKVLASVITPLCAAGLGITAYLVGMFFLAGWFPPLELLGQILILTVAHAICMVVGGGGDFGPDQFRAGRKSSGFVCDCALCAPDAGGKHHHVLPDVRRVMVGHRRGRAAGGYAHPDRPAAVPARGAALARDRGTALRPDGRLLLALLQRGRAQPRGVVPAGRGACVPPRRPGHALDGCCDAPRSGARHRVGRTVPAHVIDGPRRGIPRGILPFPAGAGLFHSGRDLVHLRAQRAGNLPGLRAGGDFARDPGAGCADAADRRDRLCRRADGPRRDCGRIVPARIRPPAWDCRDPGDADIRRGDPAGGELPAGQTGGAFAGPDLAAGAGRLAGHHAGRGPAPVLRRGDPRNLGDTARGRRALGW